MYKKYLMVAGGILACFSAGAAVSFAEETVQVIEVSDFSSSLVKTKQAVEVFARNDAEIMKQYDLFVSSLQVGISKGSLSEKEASKVLDAVAFAAEKHQEQVRKTAKKTPYFIHPLGVTYYVMKIGQVYDSEVLIAALLHDTLEDNLSTAEEITERYGKSVADYVSELTDNKALPLKERKKQQIIHAFHQSKGAAVIKFADKLHNLGTLMKDPPEGWNQDRMDQYFQWAQAVIDNLPQVNDPLKLAVHKRIAKYWESQQ